MNKNLKQKTRNKEPGTKNKEQRTRTTLIPYGQQWITEEDIQEVVEVLRTDWITQGAQIEAFEEAVADYCGARYAVAVSSGTAALHLACLAAGLGPGDEAITSPLTFVATANAVVYCRAKPVFVDIDAQTYNLDSKNLQSAICNLKSVRAVLPVHFAGQPCNLGAIQRIARKYNLTVIEDASHALGAEYKSENEWLKVGCCKHSDMAVLSFHPVKHITTGEGGMVLTNRKDLGEKLRMLRHHGITKASDKFINKEMAFSQNHEPRATNHERGTKYEERRTKTLNPWYYELQELGFNYRITDFQCALGLSQLKRIDEFVQRRRKIAQRYNEAFKEVEEIITPYEAEDVRSAYHIYVIQLKTELLKGGKGEIFASLRAENLGVNVHYIPVHLQPFYRQRYGYKPGDYPKAEQYYERALTLPLFPKMSDAEVETVIRAVLKVVGKYR